LSYAGLEDQANKGAQLLRSLELHRIDVMVVMLDNELALFGIARAAECTGLYLTSVSTRLSISDAAYTVADSGAKLLVVCDRLAEVGRQIAARNPSLRLLTVSESSAASERCSTEPIADESPGTDMLYSSGTTGHPKGVKPPLPTEALGSPTPLTAMGPLANKRCSKGMCG
jgi:long-chain acyl-CoA synthetase